MPRACALCRQPSRAENELNRLLDDVHARTLALVELVALRRLMANVGRDRLDPYQGAYSTQSARPGPAVGARGGARIAWSPCRAR